MFWLYRAFLVQMKPLNKIQIWLRCLYIQVIHTQVIIMKMILVNYVLLFVFVRAVGALLLLKLYLNSIHSLILQTMKHKDLTIRLYLFLIIAHNFGILLKEQYRFCVFYFVIIKPLRRNEKPYFYNRAISICHAC